MYILLHFLFEHEQQNGSCFFWLLPVSFILFLVTMKKKQASKKKCLIVSVDYKHTVGPLFSAEASKHCFRSFLSVVLSSVWVWNKQDKGRRV